MLRSVRAGCHGAQRKLFMPCRDTTRAMITEMAATTSIAAAGALGKAAKRWGQRAADTDWAEVTSKMRDDLGRIRDDAARMREDLASATR